MAEKPKITPAMRQYLQVKQELEDPETLLLFRMGDFYELFFEDAERGSQIMEITLTRRAGIPMSGIPYHALQNYLPKIIEQGVKVAIAEQMEDPSQAKGIVRREVARIITPGTVLDNDLLNSGTSNFIAAIYESKEAYGLACLDISTGEFRGTECPNLQSLESELHRLTPAECVVTADLKNKFISKDYQHRLPAKIIFSTIDAWLFDFETARDLMKSHFKVATLDGFGLRDNDLVTCAAGAALHYASNNLRCNPDHITFFGTYSNQGYVTLDRISQRNLELVTPIFSDSKNSTLLSVLDKTNTPMGKRLIREWITRPLYTREAIEERLDAVETLYQDQILLNEIRETINGIRDLERTISRVSVGSANGRDLLSLSRSLSVIPMLHQIIDTIENPMLLKLRHEMDDLSEMTSLIDEAINEEAPLTVKDGNLIKTGYNDTLDELHRAATDGKQWIAEIQAKEIAATGIKTMKIKYNKVFGYFIEVSHAYKEQVPAHYIRKQTLVNAERYITPDLKEVEDKILGAEDKSKALEYEIFQEIREKVVAETPVIQKIARALAHLDSLCSFAFVSLNQNYVRPKLNKDGILDIQDGRHPVVDALLEDEPFVPNDTLLDCDDNQMAIITGPNMAGKSTYIRQVALITIMAQIGCFVPAREANIGLVDRIFTRIGAADDLARGQSTFMVEMTETANILNHATSRSLIILDEIGRGTSTFDGLSLAWAIAEYLLEDTRARTLFATHYHELTELALTQTNVQNYNVAVREWKDEIIFLRKIIKGGTDKSYGIQVARLAGLPLPVIERAREVLGNLESKELNNIGQPKIATHHEQEAAKVRRKRRKEKPVDRTMLLDFGD